MMRRRKVGGGKEKDEEEHHGDLLYHLPDDEAGFTTCSKTTAKTSSPSSSSAEFILRRMSTSYSTDSGATTVTTTSSSSSDEDDDEVPSPQDHQHIQPSNAAPYTIYHTSSSIPYPQPVEAHVLNKELNLACGLHRVLPNPMHPRLRGALEFVMSWNVLVWLELVGRYLWGRCIPLWIRHYMVMWTWRFYHFCHSATLHNRTSIHPQTSLEYHSLTTSLYFCRYFPCTVDRMRYSLNQFECLYPPSYDGDGSSWVEEIDLRGDNGGWIKGAYVHYRDNHHHGNNDATEEDEGENNNEKPRRKKVLFWIFGGAYLAGDVTGGNLGLAQSYFSNECQCDVFLVEYRLLPEHTFEDAFRDVLASYMWLVNVRGIKAEDVILFGISAGGGLAVHLMQYVAARSRGTGRGGRPAAEEEAVMSSTSSSWNAMDDNEDEEGKGEDKGGEDYEGATITTSRKRGECGAGGISSGGAKSGGISSPGTTDDSATKMMPAGAVLMSPFVDYTEPKGSVLHYAVHDLIVNQSFFECALAYRERLDPNKSPLKHSMKDLPPICVVSSEHEVCRDQCIELINRVREDQQGADGAPCGVESTLAIWKYMCHTFPVLSAFIPEGRDALDLMKRWINDHF